MEEHGPLPSPGLYEMDTSTWFWFSGIFFRTADVRASAGISTSQLQVSSRHWLLLPSPSVTAATIKMALVLPWKQTHDQGLWEQQKNQRWGQEKMGTKPKALEALSGEEKTRTWPRESDI